MASHRRFLQFLSVILAIVLILAACGGSDDAVTDEAQAIAPEPDPTEAPAEPEPEPEPTAAPEPEPTEAPEPEPTAEPEPEPTAEPQAPTEGDFSAVSEAVQAFVDDRGLNGAGLIIVHRDDGVVYHEHFGEFTEDRISLVASSSKMISAGVLLKLQEQGLLDIDTPIAEIVEWAEGNPDITPAQLVSNSSGLVGLGPDLLYGPYICQWLAADELEKCGQSIFNTSGDDDDIIAPDTEFRYGGAQWQVAGALAETASGLSWAELINDIYVEPCGLESLGYISLGSVLSADSLGYPTVFGGDPDSIDPTENPNIEGGAYVTTGDYGKLLLMHLRDGLCGDNQVLSAESLAAMHADRIGPTYDGDAGGTDTGYGMGWWVDRQGGQIQDPGAFGAVPWLDLDDGYGAYLVVEATSDVGLALAQQIDDLVHRAVTGEDL